MGSEALHCWLEHRKEQTTKGFRKRTQQRQSGKKNSSGAPPSERWPFIPKNAVSPRKSRKTRKNQYVPLLTIHPLGDGLQFGISLKIFVLFVFFVDEMIFLGL